MSEDEWESESQIDEGFSGLGDLFQEPAVNKKQPPAPVFVFKAAAPLSKPPPASKKKIPPPPPPPKNREIPVCPICNQRLHYCTTDALVTQHVDECLNMSALREEGPPPPPPIPRGKGGRAVLTDSDYARQLAAEQQALDDARNSTTPSSNDNNDDWFLAVQCPYAGCNAKMGAFSFPNHVASIHHVALAHAYACPVCALEQADRAPYKVTAATNLLEHVRMTHGDLLRTLPPRAAAVPSFGGVPPPPPPPSASTKQAVFGQAAAVAASMGLGKEEWSPPPIHWQPAHPHSGGYPPPPPPYPYPHSVFSSPAPAASLYTPFASMTISPSPPAAAKASPPPPPPPVQFQSPAPAQSSSASPSTQRAAPLYREDTLAADLKIECTICLEEFTKGQQIVRLECLCVFHTTCAVAWWQKSKTCPLHQPD